MHCNQMAAGKISFRDLNRNLSILVSNALPHKLLEFQQNIKVSHLSLSLTLSPYLSLYLSRPNPQTPRVPAQHSGDASLSHLKVSHLSHNLRCHILSHLKMSRLSHTLRCHITSISLQVEYEGTPSLSFPLSFSLAQPHNPLEFRQHIKLSRQ